MTVHRTTGTARIELYLPDAALLTTAAGVLAGVGTDRPYVDAERRVVSVDLRDGISRGAVARMLDVAGVSWS